MSQPGKKGTVVKGSQKKRDEEKKTTTRAPSPTPSVQSHTSALEWDPSADVGSSARSEHGMPTTPRSNRDRDVDEDELALLNSPTDRPRIPRSKSFEHQLEQEEDERQGVGAQRNVSLGELADKPLKLVEEQMKKKYSKSEVKGSGSSSSVHLRPPYARSPLPYMGFLDSFGTRRTILDKVKSDRAGSKEKNLRVVQASTSSQLSNESFNMMETMTGGVRDGKQATKKEQKDLQQQKRRKDSSVQIEIWVENEESDDNMMGAAFGLAEKPPRPPRSDKSDQRRKPSVIPDGERTGSSNSESVSTIMPPPSSRPGSNNKAREVSSGSGTGSATSSLPHDLQSIDDNLPKNKGPLRSSRSAEDGSSSGHERKDLPSAYNDDVSSRSVSMIDLGVGHYDSGSTAVPIVAVASSKKTPSGSSFVDDLSRIGHSSRDRNIVSPGQNQSGEVPPWLEVGMTKSEKEYKKRKESSNSDSARSHSSVYVEVEKQFEQIEVRSVGQQTSYTRGSRAEDEEKENNIYHSTPTDSRLPRSHNSTDKTRRRGRSPPKPFAAASRKSPHSHHNAHHSRLERASHTTESEERPTTPRNSRSTPSNSDLSPPCFVLDQLAARNAKSRSPKKKNDIMNAIKVHRDYHIKKVKHELRQLEKLSLLLAKDLSDHKHSTSSSSESGHRGERQVTDDMELHKARPVTATQGTARNAKKDANTATSHSSSGDLSGAGANPAGTSTRAPQDVSSGERKRDALEKRLEELTDAFCCIKDLLAERGIDADLPNTKGVQVSERKKPTTQKNNDSTPKCRVQSPVAYFIPFPNCQGQYGRGDLHRCNGARQQHRIDTSSRTVSRQELHVEESEAGYEVAYECECRCDEENIEIENEDPVQRACDEIHLRYTLQDACEQRRPSFVNRARQREAAIAQIRAEREDRAVMKREWIRQCGNTSGCLRDVTGRMNLPPKGPRLMSTKEMRQLTERNYKKLPEVRRKIIQRKAEEERKTNRIMSQVFAHQLQKGVLSGEVNFGHNRSLLRR